MQNGYAALRSGIGTPKLGNGIGRIADRPLVKLSELIRSKRRDTCGIDDVTHPDRRKRLSPALSSRIWTYDDMIRGKEVLSDS